MLANNDIGTIQPIREAAKIVRDFNKKNRTSTSPFFAGFAGSFPHRCLPSASLSRYQHGDARR